MIDPTDAVQRLLALGSAIRDKIIEGRDFANDSVIVAREGGDAIFAIDRRVEPLILAAIAAWPAALLPALLVCEGLGPTGQMRIGPPGPLKCRVIIDPIDGTRGLMYDKRAAWFLAAITEDRGETTTLANSVASVMVELPTSKQRYTDSFWAAGAGPAKAARYDLATGQSSNLAFAASNAPTLRNGFAQVANFFPGVKRLAADLMETIAAESLGAISITEALVYEDQYISSGGQLVELMCGHDRMTLDLRPLFYEILRTSGDTDAGRGLCCHPYDLAGLHVAQRAGVILTDGFGAPLDAPLSVDADIHWCGYANAKLFADISPIVSRWLKAKLA